MSSHPTETSGNSEYRPNCRVDSMMGLPVGPAGEKVACRSADAIAQPWLSDADFSTPDFRYIGPTTPLCQLFEIQPCSTYNRHKSTL